MDVLGRGGKEGRFSCSLLPFTGLPVSGYSEFL